MIPGWENHTDEVKKKEEEEESYDITIVMAAWFSQAVRRRR